MMGKVVASSKAQIENRPVSACTALESCSQIHPGKNPSSDFAAPLAAALGLCAKGNRFYGDKREGQDFQREHCSAGQACALLGFALVDPDVIYQHGLRKLGRIIR